MALHLERHGFAPTTDPAAVPLLLVHGLGGDRHSWTPLVDRLAGQRELLVVELPGFGASPPLPADVEPTPAALAAALAGTLDEQGIARVDVVGVSLGGWVALELADARAATGVRTVTALAPAGFWSGPLAPSRGSARRVGRLLSPVLPLLLRSRRLRASVLGGTLGGPARFRHRAAVELVRGYVDATDFDRVNAAMRSRAFDVAGRLAGLAERLPVHVVWAGRDRMVVAPATPLAPAVHVHHLPEAGHMPMFDVPDQLAELLLRITAPALRSDPTAVPAGKAR